MTEIRKIKKIVTGKDAIDGAGVKLVRVIGFHDTADFDPFLMLDAFDSVNPSDYIKGFPWHPHRGIETITYLVEGEIEHGDSLGNKGSILSGECQWMTAGSGIIHQEMPQPSKRLFGVQLWLNLPAKNKMTTPEYNDIKAVNVPVISEENATIKIISGVYNSIPGAFQGDYVAAQYLDIDIKPGREWSINTPPEDTFFIYIMQGAGCMAENDNAVISDKQAILFTPGDKIAINAGDKGIRFILLSGKPLKESIAWGGPIVMNTQAELNQAFAELDNGTFIEEIAKPI